MDSCITKDYKELLQNFISKDTSKELVLGILGALDICKGGPTGPVRVGSSGSTRTIAGTWPEAVYYDAKGNITTHTSPSQLFEELMGQRPSGSICMIEEDKETGQVRESCKSLSMVDSFQASGLIVRGNGEAPPVTGGKSDKETTRAHIAWKEQLKNSGKKFLVFHPDSPQAKKLDDPWI